ncbi:uncharacterized protein DFL_008307 [Arthrobotrys flagrans]|uniref:Uncharacterized protein n=1 Tax=Arthrobotrys flagrans TaxID=97331 RepID=A0A436ZNF0_ARTFL|nr:hypothetical protein DFL_008307 [Arthrobotrys flagrans]
MLFTTTIALLPLLTLALAKIDPTIDQGFTAPWTGKTGPVPRFECMCDCGSPEASKQVITELCEGAIELGPLATYIACSGVERTKWTAPVAEQGEAEQDV